VPGRLLLNEKHIELVKELYYNKRLTMSVVSQRLGVSLKTLRKFMNLHNLPRRNHADYKVLLDEYKEEIRRLYWDEELTMTAIAERYGVTVGAISDYMKKCNIPTRGGYKLPRTKESAEEIRRLYWDEGLTSHQIGELLGVSNTTILDLMRHYNIPTRQGGHVPSLTAESAEEIRRLYWDEELAPSEIADQLHVTTGIVCYSMKKNNIPTRSLSEAARVRLGSVDRWKDTRGYIWLSIASLSDEDQELARRMTSNSSIQEHRLIGAKKEGRPLTEKEHVHHMDGDKTNNDPENLLVCSSREHAQIMAGYKNRIRELQEQLKELQEQLKELQLAAD